MDNLIESSPHHVKVVAVEEFMKDQNGAKPYLINRVHLQIVEGDHKGEKLHAYEAQEGKRPAMELVAGKKIWVSLSPPKSGAFDGPMVSKTSAPMTEEQAAMMQADLGYSAAEIGTMEASGIIPRNTPQPIIHNFLLACKEMGANPFLKHIYLMESGGNGGKKYYHVTNVHFAKGMALKHGLAGQGATLFDGLTLTQWIKENGEVTKENRPKSVSKTIYRMLFGSREAFEVEIRWSEYIGTSPIHGSKACRMMDKTCEMHALRSAFADILGGLYAPEEIELIRTGPPLATMADNGKGLSQGLKALEQAGTIDELKELAEQFEEQMNDDLFVAEINAKAEQLAAQYVEPVQPEEPEQQTLFQ